MDRIFQLIGAVALGGGLIYIGSILLSGSMMTGGGRKARLFMTIQEQLVAYLGQTGAGLLLIAVGALIALFLIKSAVFDKSQD